MKKLILQICLIAVAILLGSVIPEKISINTIGSLQSSGRQHFAVQNSQNQLIEETQETTTSQNEKNELREKWTLVRVVDGDTIVVESVDPETHKLTKIKVRLIGINAPESVDPRRPVQCYGKEASQFLKSMLHTGDTVYLVADPTQQNRDAYDRLLRYVYLKNNNFVNKILIEKGYAYEYTYTVPYTFQKEFKESERIAREGLVGLWNEATCSGRR